MNMRLILCAVSIHSKTVKQRPEWDALFGDMVVHEFRCRHCNAYLGLSHIERGYVS